MSLKDSKDSSVNSGASSDVPVANLRWQAELSWQLPAQDSRDWQLSLFSALPLLSPFQIQNMCS